jgi:hypothetical protein
MPLYWFNTGHEEVILIYREGLSTTVALLRKVKDNIKGVIRSCNMKKYRQ